MHRLIIALISTLIVVFLWQVTIKSGSTFCTAGSCDIVFWGAHTADGLWHAAIIQHSFDSFPFTVPILSGFPLTGYNYLLDLIGYPLHALGMSSTFVYFKILPIIWIVVMLPLLWHTSRILGKSHAYFAALLFTIFFGTGAYFIFTLIHKTSPLLTEGFGGALLTVNMQFAYSLIGVLAIMHVLLTQKDTFLKSVALGLLLSIVTWLKFYSGVISLVLIGTFYIAEYIQRRNGFPSLARSFVVVSGFFALIIVCVYNPFQGGVTGTKEAIFTVAPFALANRIIEEPTWLYMPNLVLARYTLLEGGWGPRLILLEMFVVVLYFFFEFGMRLSGFVAFGAHVAKRKAAPIDIALFLATLVGVFLSLTLVQRGQWWNVIQFLYVSLFLISFHTADALTHLLHKRTVLSLSIFSILALSVLPFNVGVLNTFGRVENGFAITPEEQEALEYLKRLPDGVYLRLPSHASHMPDSSYVTVYGDKEAYIDAVEVLKVLGDAYKPRLQEVQNSQIESLRKNVDYIYAYGPEKSDDSYETNIRRAGKKLFKNSAVTIYSLR